MRCGVFMIVLQDRRMRYAGDCMTEMENVLLFYVKVLLHYLFSEGKYTDFWPNIKNVQREIFGFQVAKSII